MVDLKLPSTPPVASPRDFISIPRGISPSEDKMVYSSGTASTVPSMPPNQRGREELIMGVSELRQVYYAVPHVNIGVAVWPFRGVPSLMTTPDRTPSIETDEIEIVPLREIPYEYAKSEIIRYIQAAGGRKVYISELAKELRLDIELIMEILQELETEQQI